MIAFLRAAPPHRLPVRTPSFEPRFTLPFALLFALLCATAALTAEPARAQSLTGVRGLVTIPTAELPPDGTLTAGFNLLNRASMTYHDGRDHAKSPYLSLVYLPFLEVGMRLTRADSPVEEALGDRTVNVRALLIDERASRPALLVGVHDFVGLKRHFQATYAVASKTFGTVPGLDHASIHLGFGTKLLDAELYDFVGFFGGIAVSPVSGIRLLAEYDSRDVNVGFDAVLYRKARIVVGLTGLHAVSGGLSYAVRLPR